MHETHIFDKLHTDQGSNFTSLVVKTVLQELGIQHFLAAVARHQSCGAEGTNKQASRHITPLLLDKIDKNPAHLSRYVSIVEHILRSHVSHETGLSPFEARFGYKPVLYNNTMDNNDNFVKKSHDEIIKIINANKLVIQEKRITTHPQLFSIGDYVILQREPGVKHPHGNFKHLGPYLITEINHEIILVKNLINGTITPYHSERLLPFNGDSISATNIAHIGQSEKVVMEIISHTGLPSRRSTMDFKVKWLDESISYLPFSEV